MCSMLCLLSIHSEGGSARPTCSTWSRETCSITLHLNQIGLLGFTWLSVCLIGAGYSNAKDVSVRNVDEPGVFILTLHHHIHDWENLV